MSIHHQASSKSRKSEANHMSVIFQSQNRTMEKFRLIWQKLFIRKRKLRCFNQHVLMTPTFRVIYHEKGFVRFGNGNQWGEGQDGGTGRVVLYCAWSSSSSSSSGTSCRCWSWRYLCSNIGPPADPGNGIMFMVLESECTINMMPG